MGDWSPAWALLGPTLFWIGLIVGILLVHYNPRGVMGHAANLPVIGILTRDLATMNAALILQAGVTAGLMFPDCLELAAGSAGNRVWSKRMLDAAKDLRHDRISSLTEALRQIEMPRDFIDLCHSGEVQW